MLTTDHLAAIDRHLRKDNWLLNEDLITELTDHYAIAIADHLSRGITFETALNDVHKGFGGHKGLLKMEEDFVKLKNKEVLNVILKIATTYFRTPRFFILILLGFGLYYTLNAIAFLDMYIALMTVQFIVFFVVGLPFFHFTKRPWGHYNWKITKRRTAGVEWLCNQLLAGLVNLPCWFLYIFIPTGSNVAEWKHLLATLIMGTTFWGYCIIMELTYRRNPIYKILT